MTNNNSTTHAAAIMEDYQRTAEAKARRQWQDNDQALAEAKTNPDPIQAARAAVIASIQEAMQPLMEDEQNATVDSDTLDAIDALIAAARAR